MAVRGLAARDADSISLGEGAGLFIKKEWQAVFGKGTAPSGEEGRLFSLNVYACVRGRRVFFSLTSLLLEKGEGEGEGTNIDRARQAGSGEAVQEAKTVAGTGLRQGGLADGDYHIGWAWMSFREIDKRYKGRAAGFVVLARKALQSLTLGRV